MKPAIWTDAFVELQPEDAVKRLAEVGWEFIELAGKHWRDMDKREDPERSLKALRNMCERLRVSIPQMHGPIFDVCMEEEKMRPEMELTKRVMRWAHVLGVKWMVFHPGSSSIAEDGEALEEVRQRNREAIMELLEEAQKLEVGIALENLYDEKVQGRRVYGSTPSELLWLIHNTDPKRVGVCWDTGHANVQRLNQSRAIRALKGHLVATHIADNDTSGDQHLLPFEGNVDWKVVTTTLKEIGYGGLFNLEIGNAVHRIPLRLRGASLQYALKLAEALCEGSLW